MPDLPLAAAGSLGGLPERCDLLVVGGGINGAGIARDAAGRGLSVVLAEQDDLAAHTSSASTKLIHGGLRYLEHYEFGLVRKALIEREVLLRSAPHIMWPLRFVMPHDPSMRPAWMIRMGVWLYDHLARREVLPGSEAIRLEIERYARVPSVLIRGEGSVKLELPGSSEYAIYYLLYNSDDVTPGHEVRAVYLNHTNSGSMYFPEGNYVLKIARGDYWISDEVGFGESGSYSKSIPKEMTAGVYFIEESTSSGFDSDSWGGLG